MNPTFPGALYQSASPRMNKRLVIAEVQRQLISGGYYQGRIDGSYGRRTAFARSRTITSVVPARRFFKPTSIRF